MEQDTEIRQVSFINVNFNELSLVSYVKFTNLNRFISNNRDINCNRMRLEYKELKANLDIDIKIVPNINNNSFIIELNFQKISNNFLEIPLKIERKLYNNKNHLEHYKKCDELEISNNNFTKKYKPITYNNLYRDKIKNLILKFKFKKIPRSCKDHVGIINEGSTCYMNSIIQTLFNLPIVNKIVSEHQNNNEIILNFKKLFYNLKNEKNAVKATNIYNPLKIKNWNSQQDAQEIFAEVIEKLNEIFRFSYLFEGIEEINENKEKFIFLILDLQRTSLIENIQNYFKDVIVENKKIVKSIFKSPPYFLLIQLKYYNKDNKIFNKIRIAEKLDLKEFYSNENKDDSEYEIYAVIVHKGESLKDVNAHYYVYVRNPYQDENLFIKFNDTTVTYASKNDLFDNFSDYTIEIDDNGNLAKNIKESKKTPYILIYTKISKREEIFKEYIIPRINEQSNNIILRNNERSNNIIFGNNEQSNKNLKSKRKYDIIDLSEYYKNKSFVRKFQVKVNINKRRECHSYEYSTTCDKKVKTIDLVYEVINKYNLNKNNKELVDIMKCKLYLKIKNVFHKFLKNNEEIQEILYDIAMQGNIELGIVIVDDNFNGNMCFNFSEDSIPPFFYYYDFEINQLDIKKIIIELKEIIKQNYEIKIDELRMFFINIEEDRNKKDYEIKKIPIKDINYFKELQIHFKKEFIKIYIKLHSLIKD